MYCAPIINKYGVLILKLHLAFRFGTCDGLCRGKGDLCGQYIQRKFIYLHTYIVLTTSFFYNLQAVEQFGNQRNKENELRVAKEKELQKVQVKKEDIELIVRMRNYKEVFPFIVEIQI